MDKQEASMRQEMANVEGASIQRNMDALAVTFKSDVLFPYDSYSLKPGSYDELDRVAKVLNQYPQTNITVAGHTDSKGTDEYNQKLSERRAAAVKCPGAPLPRLLPPPRCGPEPCTAPARAGAPRRRPGACTAARPRRSTSASTTK